MSTPHANFNPGETIWHITVDLAYEGEENDSCQVGVERVFSALRPLIENGSCIKQVFVMKLPEKETIAPSAV
jgi:hypothetical protein